VSLGSRSRSLGAAAFGGAENSSVPLPRRSRFLLPEADHRLRSDPLLYALSLMILTNVWRLQDLFGPLSILKLNLVATALTIGLLVFDRDPARHISKLKSPILVCLLLVFGLATLGVPMSLWSRRSATFVFTAFLPNLLLMVIVAAAVRSVRDLYWLAMVNVIGACIFSVFVNLNFEIGTGGRLNNLVYYDANDLALVLVCTLPFAILFIVRQGWRHRLMGLAALVLLVVTIAKSGSRGGFLGFVAVLLYMLFGYRAVPTRVRILASAVVIGLLAVVASDAYWKSISTLGSPQQDYNWVGGSPEGRIEVWRRGLRYIADNPFLGVGMANFPMAEGLSEVSRARAERGAGFKWSVAHNTFLEIGVELGLIAFTLFVAALFIAFRQLHRMRAARPLQDPAIHRNVAFACTLIASLVGFIVSGFFVSATHFSYLYVLLGLSMGFAKICGRRLPSAGWSGRRSRVAVSGRRALASSDRAPLADRVRVSSTRQLNQRKRDPRWRG
jgi:O-antigen ligase